jgi:two-component system, cell cycle response regulator
VLKDSSSQVDFRSVIVDPLSRVEGSGLRVLVAEDDASSRYRLQAALRSWGYEVESVGNGREAIAALARPDGPSLAVLDWSMPEADGLEVCRSIRSRPDGRYVYAILLTAHDRDEDVLAGFDAGADDYVTKPFNTKELRARVRSGARIVQLQQELVAAREELREKAMHDPLTGLLTRGAFFEICEVEFARAKRKGTALSLVMADIDHFKSINDRFGHVAGDDVLREVARRLQSTFRVEDAVGRYGGEEFVALAVGCSGPDAIRLADRFRQTVARDPFPIGSAWIDVTTSVGVAAGTASDGAQILLKAADDALYRAKAGGRNMVVASAATAPIDADSRSLHEPAAP